jgi:hypothetical protein
VIDLWAHIRVCIPFGIQMGVTRVVDRRAALPTTTGGRAPRRGERRGEAGDHGWICALVQLEMRESEERERRISNDQREHKAVVGGVGVKFLCVR